MKSDWLRQWIPITLILLLTAALYLYQLGTESLWLDELYSIHDAQELNLLNARPLYYILLRLWMQFGTSDAWLRGLSVLFGLGSVFLNYQLGRRLAGETTGLIAALLLALSPLFINHAQELRMYTLSTFLGLGGTLALTDALEHQTTSSIRWWAGARLLAFLTTPLNVTLLLPDIVLFGLRFRHQRRVLLAFGKWLLLIGIFWLPTAIALANVTPEFMSGWVAKRPHPSVMDVVRMLTKFTGWSWDSPLNAIAWFYKRFFKVYALMLMCLLGVALLNKQHPKLIWVATWAFLPSATIFLISYVSSSIWLERYLLFVCPYVLILLAAGFTRIWHSQRTVATVVALVYIVGLGGGLARYYTVQNREDWRGVAQTISINEKPGDVIGLSLSTVNSRPLPLLAHYYHGSAPIHVMKIFSVSEKPVVKRVLRSLPPIKSHLWLVYRHPISEERRQIFQAVVREQFRVQNHWTFKDIDLFLVNRRVSSEGRG